MRTTANFASQPDVERVFLIGNAVCALVHTIYPFLMFELNGGSPLHWIQLKTEDDRTGARLWSGPYTSSRRDLSGSFIRQSEIEMSE